MIYLKTSKGEMFKTTELGLQNFITSCSKKSCIVSVLEDGVHIYFPSDISFNLINNLCIKGEYLYITGYDYEGKYYEVEEKQKVGFQDDKLFLLSKEEYEKYKDAIPKINTGWILRTPGKHTEDSICEVNQYGECEIYFRNYSGIRPAFKFRHLCISPLMYKFFYGGVVWVVIDEENKIAISELPIGFERFDSSFTDYKNSHIRFWLEGWLSKNRDE